MKKPGEKFLRKLPRNNFFKGEASSLGASLGLRPILSQSIFDLKLDWLEIITDDFLNVDARHIKYLEKHRSNSQIVCHSVGLNIGSTDPLNLEYLNSLREFYKIIEPAWVSDHLCWTGVLGHPSFDLLPLPYNPESLEHLLPRIQKAQDCIGRNWVFENPSSYFEIENSEMSEGEFLSELTKRSGCELLLDINNVVVSGFNLKKDPDELIKDWPFDSVVQYHLAGASLLDEFMIDTHNQSIAEPVWTLFRKALKKTGPLPTLIEWDRDFPEFSIIHNQLKRAQGELIEFARLSNPFLPTAP